MLTWRSCKNFVWAISWLESSSVIRLDMGTNRPGKNHCATTPWLRWCLCRRQSPGSDWCMLSVSGAGISSAQHFSVCLSTAPRSHARSAPACPVTNVDQTTIFLAYDRQGRDVRQEEPGPAWTPSKYYVLHQHQRQPLHTLPDRLWPAPTSPACVLLEGADTTEVLQKVDPRHSIIASAFKWKFHKFWADNKTAFQSSCRQKSRKKENGLRAG